MGKPNHPQQDDHDMDGIPDDPTPRAHGRVADDIDGDGVSDRETQAQNNPIIINRTS